MEIGREYNLYIHEENNHLFVCIDCGTLDDIYSNELLEALAKARGKKLVPEEEGDK